MSDVKLSINEWLRYFFAGAITVAATVNYLPQNLLDRLGSSSPPIAAASLLALVCGAFIYALHRAILNPLIHRLALAICWKMEDSRPLHWLVPAAEEAYYRGLWELGKEDPYREHFRNWASHIHMLYCISWGLILVWILGSLHGEPEFDYIQHFLAVVAIAALISAFVSNCRLVIFVQARVDPTPSAEGETDSEHPPDN